MSELNDILEKRYQKSVHDYKNRMKAYLLSDIRAQSSDHIKFFYFFGTATDAEEAAVDLLRDELESKNGFKVELAKVDVDGYDVTRLIVRVNI